MTGSPKTLALAALAAISLATAAHAAPRAVPGPEPEMMTYDFKTGTKSTTFADGTVIEESFDVEKARKFAPRPDGKDVTTNLSVR